MLMRCLSLLLLWLFASQLFAQQATYSCAGVAEPAARLACYDKTFPPPPEVIEEAKQKAQADFGLSKSREPLGGAGQAVQSVVPGSVESRVVKVSGGRDGQRIFTLENGQVWTQTEARSTGHVRAGETVRVRKGILGGYQLVMSNGVALRVRRTR